MFSAVDYKFCFTSKYRDLKAIDPGVKMLITCCTLFVEEDVRTTKYHILQRTSRDDKIFARRRQTLDISKRVLLKRCTTD